MAGRGTPRGAHASRKLPHGSPQDASGGGAPRPHQHAGRLALPAVPPAVAAASRSSLSARFVDYDAPLVEKLAERLARHGSIASAERRGPVPKTIDAAQMLADSLTVQNGIARVVTAEIGVATHVGVVIQYDVLADERMSGIVSAWVSPDTRSVPDGFSQEWEEISADSRDESQAGQDATPSSVDVAGLTSFVTRAWPIVQAVSTSAMRASLEPFLASLTRRRDRDLDRVHQYYREIHNELARKAARHQGEARAREEARLYATMRAWEARVEEVAARYRTRVTLAPVTALVCRMPACLARTRAVAAADRRARRDVALRRPRTHNRAAGMRSLQRAHTLGLPVRRPRTLPLPRVLRAVRRVRQIVLSRVCGALSQDASDPGPEITTPDLEREWFFQSRPGRNTVVQCRPWTPPLTRRICRRGSSSSTPRPTGRSEPACGTR